METIVFNGKNHTKGITSKMSMNPAESIDTDRYMYYQYQTDLDEKAKIWRVNMAIKDLYTYEIAYWDQIDCCFKDVGCNSDYYLLPSGSKRIYDSSGPQKLFGEITTNGIKMSKKELLVKFL